MIKILANATLVIKAKNSFLITKSSLITCNKWFPAF